MQKKYIHLWFHIAIKTAHLSYYLEGFKGLVYKGAVNVRIAEIKFEWYA